MAVEADYQGKKVLVVGAARSGIAAAEFLLSHGARVTLTDLRPETELSASIAPLKNLAQTSGELVLQLGEHQTESFRSCDFVIISPGVPYSLPYFKVSMDAGIPILAEVELAFRHLKGKILGITGSNGKTTTTFLVAELLRGAGLKGLAAGNIGTPLISFVARSSRDDIYATELSSFQLETIRTFRPAVGAILNLTPDHMDRYPGFEAYIAAKRRIFMNQQPSDFAVLNADDPRTAAMASEVPSKPVLFSRCSAPSRGSFVHDQKLIYRDGHGDIELFARSDIALKGEHNLENVLAACSIAVLAGADPRSARAVVTEFKGVEHRLEWVAEIDGVQYFNDSKATNVDATVKSLESFPSNIRLILGGRDKGGDFTRLRPLVEERVKQLVLLGEAAGKIREALAGTADMSEAKSLEEAILQCKRGAQPGDVVLLAPACASFDMFQNYEHRGNVFKKFVRDLQR
jgi:UDP-N-acetylmuramoylalanine--D-glutamate ligase